MLLGVTLGFIVPSLLFLCAIIITKHLSNSSYRNSQKEVDK